MAGDLCYPVYLIHWPVLHYVIAKSVFLRGIISQATHLVGGGKPIKHIMTTLLVSGIALSISAAWVWAERNGLEKYRTRLRGRERAPAV